MKMRWLPPTVLCLAMSLLAWPLSAQSSASSLYAESFRQGPTRIIEDHFEVKLTPRDPVYRERIRDSRGSDRYALSITPRGPEGDSEITSWQVTLADLRHSIYDNILRSLKGLADNPAAAKDALWWLDPSRFSRVPANAKRIIKVDSFYVVLQIKTCHFTPIDSPYLDSMTVNVELTNTDPRAGESTQK
jgi:hypothetical protein